MAEKNYQKHLELLRVLLHEGKAMNNKALAERLGMSESTFQKTATHLNELIHRFQYEKMPAAQAISSITETIQYAPYELSADHFYQLYLHSGLSEDRFLKDAIILSVLDELQPATVTQIEQRCFDYNDKLQVQFQEKYVARALKRWTELGYVKATTANKGRKKVTSYQLVNFSLVVSPIKKELYAFLHHARHNTMLPSLTYAIERKLRHHLQQHEHHTLYPYHYPGKLLEDATVIKLIEILEAQTTCSFYYAPVYYQRKFIANFEDQLTQFTVLPRTIIYDVAHSRWYLIAQVNDQLSTYRIDHIYQLQQNSEFAPFEKLSLEHLETSWNSSLQPTVQVKVRFYQQHTNFIEQRVQTQGGHGIITARYEDGFDWQINVNGTSEIIPWLRSFGSSAEILAPATLRAQFKQQWREMEIQYDAALQ